MLVNIISQHLGTHKRLVVPRLGAFIVKQPDDTILFSELLQRDDGELRQLLMAKGMSELEAAGEIDRFVFEVRHAVEQGEEYALGTLGIMKRGENGTITFVHTPRKTEPAPQKPDEQEKPPQQEQEQPHEKPAAETLPPPKPITPSVKMNPDPALRDLRYGKPHKNTDAYTYVNRPVRRRRVLDLFVWIALLAAAIALAVIAFGYYRNMQEGQGRETNTMQYENNY